MLVHVPAVVTPDELAVVRRAFANVPWADGRRTPGHQSALAKHNLQLPEEGKTAHELADLVLRALERNGLFMAAALPRHVFPPLFNRYRKGMEFGSHIDNAIRQQRGGAHRLRTDVSATLFLSDVADYDGGELVIEDPYGSHAVNLPAGDMIIYPATSLHRVRPVTRGQRDAAFLWVQSMVKDDGERTLLFNLDRAIQELAHTVATDSQALLQLTACYHNLIRKWAQM